MQDRLLVLKDKRSELYQRAAQIFKDTDRNTVIFDSSSGLVSTLLTLEARNDSRLISGHNILVQNGHVCWAECKNADHGILNENWNLGVPMCSGTP